MTNKHISFTAKKEVWKFLKMKALEEETTMKALILEALREKYDDLPESTKKEDLGKRKKGNIELSELSEEIIELTKDLDGGMYGSDEAIQEITLDCLRYLKSKREASHKDFKSDVYPRFEDAHTEENFWKLAREGLKQIERKRMFSEKDDIIETPKGRSHRKYTWKL